ncbi:interleukin-12 receptor subunit beta-2-like [Mantella aurantiaca]
MELYILLFAETCDYAEMEIRPSNVTRVGSMVTITCTRKSNGKPGVRITNQINKNNDKWANLHGNAVTINDTSLTPGRISYKCKNAENKLVCGTYVDFGLPPDQPRIISCEQEGEFGNISCSWVLERYTGIKDKCILQLQMGQHITDITLECQNGTNSLTLPVAAIPDGEYSVSVVTSNPLGTNTSQSYNFTFYDIVRPHPPTNLTISCHQTSEECSVTVTPEWDIQQTRLRYRAREPRGKLEVWYKLRRVNDKTRSVTLHWKHMTSSEVGGHLRFYQVTFRRENESRTGPPQNTTDTSCSADLESGDYVITVSAHNSRGSSAPATCRVTHQEVSAQDSLPPINLIAASNSASNSVTLAWDLPAGSEDSGWDQIVEWEDPTEKKPNRANWVKVPKFNRTVTLSGHYKPYICYRFRVCFLREGRAGVPMMTTASVQEKAPETALEIRVDVKKNGPVLVTWRDVPPEKQMGCTLHYTIYLKEMTSGLTKEVKVLYKQMSQMYRYELDRGSMEGRYVLWVTFSNGAGETTARQEVYFTVDGTQEDYVIIYIILAIIVSGFMFLFFCLKQRLRRLLSKILPNTCVKAVPDPANCEWAKEYISDKGKLRSFPSHASSASDCDEAETLEIEVLSSEDEGHYCPTYTITPLLTASHREEKDGGFGERAEAEQSGSQQAERNLYRSIVLQPEGGVKGPASDYLVNHVITMDYLPKNILTVYEKSEDDVFHPHFPLSSWVMASGTIPLDTVRIDLS